MRPIVLTTGAQRCDSETVFGGRPTDREYPYTDQGDPVMRPGGVRVALMIGILSATCARSIAVAVAANPTTATAKQESFELCEDFYEGRGGHSKDFAKA